MSIIYKVKNLIQNFKGEEVLFSIIFIITLFYILLKTKHNNTSNSSEHLVSIVLYTCFISTCIYLSWFVLENLFKINNLPPISLLYFLFFAIIIPHLSFIFIKKFLLDNYKVSSKVKPSIIPFLIIPLFNLLVTFIYIINQSSDTLINMDIIGNVFKFIKIDNSHPVSEYIIYYLIGETIVILLNIIYLHSGTETKSSLDIFCDSPVMISKIEKLFYPNYNCLESIHIDINLFTMFIKTFAIIIYTITIYKFKN